MNIEKGWLLWSVDFSIQATKPNALGQAMLIRDIKDRAMWHKMADELKEVDDGPELYVSGSGMTIEEAIVNANLAAAQAKPIPMNRGE